MSLDPSLIEDLKEAYQKIAADGPINKDNVSNVFKEIGEGIAAFQLRDVCTKMNKSGGETISFDEFIQLKGSKLKDNVQTKAGVTSVSGYEQTQSGTKHSVSDSERYAFSNYINKLLGDDKDAKKYLPIDPNGEDLYKILSDGIILCKLVNIAQPNTIDERAINKNKINNFTATENLTLGINSCSAIGCHVVNIGTEDIKEGRVHLVLGLLWQVIRIAIFQHINIKATPDLLCMLKEGETPEQLLSLSPEEILLRWVNYQLEKGGSTKTVSNFGKDLADSSVYAVLEDTIMKEHCIHSPAKIDRESDPLKRAAMVIDNSDKAGIIGLVSPYDIANGNTKLNMVFIADMFNKYPNLQAVEAPPVIEETREEKAYRNWLNSLGLKPFVNYIYSDLSDGLILLQAFEHINPDSKATEKVNRPPFKPNQAHLKKTENCNKFVDLAKSMNFSTVNLSGEDIAKSSQQHILSIVFQMMRRYQMQILQKLSGGVKPLTDPEIVAWVNNKFKESGKDLQISGFNDANVINSKAIFEMVEILKPGTVDQSLVNSGTDPDDMMNNAKLSISLARKIGANVYALPEDVVEGKSKMVATIFACLMIVAFKK